MSNLGSKSAAVKQDYVQRASPLALCIAATGHLPSAILLYRIYWWKDHTRFKRDGHLWIVKSVDQWMVDTGLTRQQFKDAKNKLLERGLIVSDRFQTSINSTLTLAAVRLSDQGAKVPNDPNAPEGAKVPNGSMADGAKVPNGSFATGAKVPNDPSTMEEEENLENEENQEEAAAAQTALPGEGFSGKIQEGGKTGKQAVPGSCSTPAALPVLVPHAAPLVKIGKGTPLPEVWQTIGEFFIGLTDDHAKADVRNGWVQAQLLRGTLPTEWGAKEWGHAKTLRDCWQNHRSALVAFVCVLRWWKFHSYCLDYVSKAEHWKLSGTPDLQCLVHFKTQAAEFMQRHLADMQADMAEAEAKAAEKAAEAKAKADFEAKLIKYRGVRYTPEGKSYDTARYGGTSWTYDEKQYIEAYLSVRYWLKGSKETNEVLGLTSASTELEEARAVGAMIDEIAAVVDAGGPVDALKAMYKLPSNAWSHIIEEFGQQEWAKRIREAEQQKIAA